MFADEVTQLPKQINAFAHTYNGAYYGIVSTWIKCLFLKIYDLLSSSTYEVILNNYLNKVAN